MSDFWHSSISIRSTLTWWKTGATKTHWGDSPLAWVHLAHPTSAPSVRKAGAEEGEICGMFLVRTGTSSLQDLLWALTHSQQLTFSRRPTPFRQASKLISRAFLQEWGQVQQPIPAAHPVWVPSKPLSMLVSGHYSPNANALTGSRWISSASVSGRKEMI